MSQLSIESVGSSPQADELLSVERIRDQFPALRRRENGKPVAYFDGPGGTQVPASVVERMSDYLLHHNANTHWNYPSSQETDELLARARSAFAAFFNATAEEVVFGNNMTSLTFHVARALGRSWSAGDEVIVTDLDHHANIAPWQALERERGIVMRSVPFDVRTGELELKQLERSFTPKTRLLAIGAASNALGTISPVREAAQLAHANHALCFVDAVHYAAHAVIDVQTMGCDFLVCSPYKFYGPHAGVMYVRGALGARLDAPKLKPAPEMMPERLETGTQNHEGIMGSAAAVDFLASLAPGGSRREKLVYCLRTLHRRGEAHFSQLWNGLSGIPGVRCFGPAPGRPRTPTIAFAVEGKSTGEVAAALARDGLFLSNGSFYASTVMKCLNRERDGLVRAGCACYTTFEEVQRLVEAVANLARA